MTNKSLKYLQNETIEEVTAKRIREYEDITGEKVSFPVPIEGIIERVLGLDFDWDVIEEKPGEQILGGLIPDKKKIMLNEKHLNLFKEKPGLERSTIGHEAGHWDVDIDHSTINHPSLLNLSLEEKVVHRKTEKSDLLVKVLRYTMTDNRSYQVYKELNKGKDAPEVKSAVDRYQSALLMPKSLIHEAIEHYNVTNWADLYSLAENANVTISNLRVRLERLGLIYIPEGSKTIYKSRHEYIGQGELF